jgi:glycosyltransferase involved in cell wall biosynthesis
MPGLLFTKLKDDGYSIIKRSAFKNILLRYVDTVLAVLFLKYDILFIQGFALRAFYLESVICKIGKIKGKKVIYNIHGGAFPEFYKRNTLWCNSVLSIVDKIVTPSHYIQAFLVSKNYEVECIPNFIEFNKFPYKWQDRGLCNLLWVRSFHDIYKPELAIQVMKKLVNQYPEITLTMVGPDQGNMQHCKQLISKFNLDKSIKVIGVIPNNELNELYSSHLIFITTTSYESFGVSLIEAAASGIPMVSTNVGEIPYIWKDKKNMLIVEDNNVELFSDAIMNLIEDSNLREKLSNNARKVAEQYNWEHIRTKWIKILK